MDRSESEDALKAFGAGIAASPTLAPSSGARFRQTVGAAHEERLHPPGGSRPVRLLLRRFHPLCSACSAPHPFTEVSGLPGQARLPFHSVPGRNLPASGGTPLTAFSVRREAIPREFSPRAFQCRRSGTAVSFGSKIPFLFQLVRAGRAGQFFPFDKCKLRLKSESRKRKLWKLSTACRSCGGQVYKTPSKDVIPWFRVISSWMESSGGSEITVKQRPAVLTLMQSKTEALQGNQSDSKASRTWPLPRATRPISRAAASDRSIRRPPWNGPRSLIRTTTDFPVLTLVT